MPTVAAQHQIANLALGFVGSRDFIQSLAEESTEAQVSAVYLPLALQTCLARRPWRFALKRAALALTTEEREGWAFCYQAPADMLRPLEVTGKRNPRADERNPFALELNDAGTAHLVCCDVEGAELRYTRDVAVGLYPALFVEAVAWRLAQYLALAIPVKPSLGINLEQKAELALQRAAAVDAALAQDDVAPESELYTVRK